MEMKLHRGTCEPALFELLQELMTTSFLEDFYLAGGTAVALHLGHRKSFDIDLFTSDSFNSMQLLSSLRKTFDIDRAMNDINTVRCFIKGIKVEIFAHEYPLLEDVILRECIRIAGLKDLAAMKLNAVAGRGSKKDFWDIAALLDLFTLEEMITFFQAKYQSADTWHLMRSLTYFDDAENEQVDIIDLENTAWQEIKDKIIEAVL